MLVLSHHHPKNLLVIIIKPTIYIIDKNILTILAHSVNCVKSTVIVSLKIGSSHFGASGSSENFLVITLCKSHGKEKGNLSNKVIFEKPSKSMLTSVGNVNKEAIKAGIPNIHEPILLIPLFIFSNIFPVRSIPSVTPSMSGANSHGGF